MRRLKVLFITEWYPSAGAPVACVFVREHAHAASLYNEVCVLHLAGRDPSLRGPWRLREETDPTITEGIPTHRLYRQRLLLLPAYLTQFWGIWRAGQQLAREGFRPDVIHAHVYAAGPPGALLARHWHVPLIITEHLSAFPRRTLRPLDLLLARLAFGMADRVLPVCHYLQGAIEAYGSRGRFTVVPNAVNSALFCPPEDDLLARHANDQLPGLLDGGRISTGGEGRASGEQEPAADPRKILYVGRLPADHSKGVPYLLRALAQLPDNGPAWRLEIVGDGPGRGELEQLAIELRLADRVSFLGTMSKADVARRMRRCSFLVLPSLRGTENQPVVLLEALACGKPVVATSCGGPEEFLTGDVGLLVPPADAEALAHALANMLSHSDQYPPERLSQYAHERYSYEAVGRQLDHIYREACASRRAS